MLRNTILLQVWRTALIHNSLVDTHCTISVLLGSSKPQHGNAPQQLRKTPIANLLYDSRTTRCEQYSYTAAIQTYSLSPIYPTIHPSTYPAASQWQGEGNTATITRRRDEGIYSNRNKQHSNAASATQRSSSELDTHKVLRK